MYVCVVAKSGEVAAPQHYINIYIFARGEASFLLHILKKIELRIPNVKI